jgi:hypothetical protein
MAQRRTQKKEKAAKRLVRLLGEHLSKFPPAEQNAMHEKLERRVANAHDSEAKTPSHLRAETR